MWNCCEPLHTEWTWSGYVPARRPVKVTAAVAGGAAVGAGACDGDGVGSGDAAATETLALGGDGEGSAAVAGPHAATVARALIDPTAQYRTCSLTPTTRARMPARSQA